MELSDVAVWLGANWEYIVMAVTGIVALTPTDKDDNIWARVKNVLGKLLGK